MATTNIQLDQQQPHQNNFTFLPTVNMRNSNIFDENLLINNNHNQNENSNNCNGNSSIIDYSNNDFNNGNTLNTPDIVDMLDSFHPTFQSEKYYNNDQNPLLFTDVYSQLDAQQSPLMLLEPTTTQTSAIMMNPASNQSMINQSMINDNYNNYQKQHNYYDHHHQHQQQIKPEPYSLLESSEINLEYMNSPEMAPVSPNKVCPQSEYEYSQQPSPLSSNNNQTISYQNLECAQPILQIKNEFDIMFDDYLNDQSQQSKQQSQLNKNQINDSPSYSISSNYSSIDSSSSSAAVAPQPKTFTLIDVVKQESFDSSTTGLLMPRQQQPQQQQQSTIVPTVVDETTASFIPQNDRQQQQQQIIYNLTPLNNLQQQNTMTPTTNYYYMTSSNNNNNTNNDPNQAHITALQSVSSSSSSINHSNHSQQQQQQQPPITNGRKRAATMNNNNNGSNNQQQTTTIKKPRMSKREKQKLMESYIDQYERENKQLIEQIELFEKQINFCKKYLNESVAPYIQQQQQNQQPIHQQIQNIIGMV